MAEQEEQAPAPAAEEQTAPAVSLRYLVVSVSGDTIAVEGADGASTEVDLGAKFVEQATSVDFAGAGLYTVVSKADFAGESLGARLNLILLFSPHSKNINFFIFLQH